MSRQKRLILTITGCFMTVATTLALAAAPKGLVGHWSLNEGKGDVAKDSSPEKNDGELWGDAKWVKEGKLTQEEMVAALNNLKSRGIIYS